jgi:hydroxymethylbilane synthase
MARSSVIRVATRGSPLALRQAGRVSELISKRSGVRAELVVVHTTGDRLADVPIAKIGGEGVFVKEVSAAVLDGRAEMAVHSAKDMPAEVMPGLSLVAVAERADPRDVLVGSRLDELPPGATVATGSVRRRAQLAWLRPDLTFCELRGNIARRIEVSKSVGAGVLAMAALERLGLHDEVGEILEPRVMLPQVGQGAIALECRSSDVWSVELLESVDDTVAHAALRAERAFLERLGSGCSLPCGALAVALDGGGLLLEAMLASRDGHLLLRRSKAGADPTELGRALAEELLEEAGGRALTDWGDDALPGPSASQPGSSSRAGVRA